MLFQGAGAAAGPAKSTSPERGRLAALLPRCATSCEHMELCSAPGSAIYCAKKESEHWIPSAGSLLARICVVLAIPFHDHRQLAHEVIAPRAGARHNHHHLSHHGFSSRSPDRYVQSFALSAALCCALVLSA